jgi:hypothetical protein
LNFDIQTSKIFFLLYDKNRILILYIFILLLTGLNDDYSKLFYNVTNININMELLVSYLKYFNKDFKVLVEYSIYLYYFKIVVKSHEKW